VVLGRSPFNALCGVASKFQWCWSLSCTTCGAHNLRFGLYAIGLGYHPDQPDWAEVVSESGDIIHPYQDRVNFRRHSSHNTLLYRALSEAEIFQIAKECRFPDSLGYLGIGLNTFADLELRRRLLTYGWAPQLRDLVFPDSFSYAALQEMIESPGETLTWRFLSSVEADFNHQLFSDRPRL